jgi:RNA polymerase sigma-70 factor (ECF subfamily)
MPGKPIIFHFMNKTEQIWINLEDKLKSFIISKTHNKDDAEDLLHEVFIRIHSNIDQVKDDTRIQSWIYQITRNQIIDYYRGNHAVTDSNSEIPEAVEDIFPTDQMEDALEDMIKMMDHLPAEYCEALCLTELQGMSQIEYAQRIGISYSGAKSRVQRSRKLLKDMLLNCCHYEFDKYGTVLNITPVTCCCCCHPGKLN